MTVSLARDLAQRHGGGVASWTQQLAGIGVRAHVAPGDLDAGERARLTRLIGSRAARLPDDLPAATLGEWAWRCLERYLELHEPWRLVSEGDPFRAASAHRAAVLGAGSLDEARPAPDLPAEDPTVAAIRAEAQGYGVSEPGVRTFAYLRALARDPGLLAMLRPLMPWSRAGAFPVRLMVRLANPSGVVAAGSLLLPEALACRHRSSGVDYWSLPGAAMAAPEVAAGEPGGALPRGMVERFDALPADRVALQLDAVAEEGLEHVLARVRHAERLAREARGLRVLFSGPDGHGRRTAARQLADALGLEIFLVRAGALPSKWVGETEQRVSLLFEAMARAGSVVLIEDAQDLFTPRTEVRQVSDRHANRMSNHLLQVVDEFPGLCLLTAPGVGSFEAAMRRRIAVSVVFRPADQGLRVRVLEASVAWLSRRPRARPAIAEGLGYGLLAHLAAPLAPGQLVHAVVEAGVEAALRHHPLDTDVLEDKILHRVRRAGGVVRDRPAAEGGAGD